LTSILDEISEETSRLKANRVLILATYLLLLPATTGIVRAEDLEQFAYGAIACKSQWNPATARGCGRTHAAPVGAGHTPTKILHGHEVGNNKYPWVVAVARTGSDKKLHVYCAGSVVGKSWVLTAAHCQVKTGDYILVSRLDLTTNSGQQVKVDRLVASIPPFQPSSKAYDALLLHLADAVKVDSIDLNEDPAIEDSANTNLTIAGWGTTSYLGKPSDVLLEADISTRAFTGCQSEYGHSRHTLPPTSFCAAGHMPAQRVDETTGDSVADACQGDSGGGAFRLDERTGRYQLVGIVSWGIGCGLDAYPGVYTRSSAISKWVKPLIANL
jgi:secreted trypsin-like serine protease